MTITKEIRSNIFDAMRLENVRFSGELNEIEFLDRLFDLPSMPSHDPRFDTAAADIWQHCVNNYDWPSDWIFSDRRFKLLTCSDDQFIKFRCEVVHPVVRPDEAEGAKIVSHFNEQLNHAGWRLSQGQKIAGRPIYIAHQTNNFHLQKERAHAAATTLSSEWMRREINRIEASIESDPALAIGTAKDLVESCCKSILSAIPDSEPVTATDDLPTLSKKLCRAIALVPEGIDSEAKGSEIIRRTLSNLASLTKSVAELRGLYGSGHGRDEKHIGLQPRHARLAASCAITFVEFATETYLHRSAPSVSKNSSKTASPR